MNATPKLDRPFAPRARFFVAAAAALLVTACAAPSGAEPARDKDATSFADPHKAKTGPSLTFEDQRDLAGNSLLAETERQREEIAKMAERFKASQLEIEQKEEAIRAARAENSALARERDELRRLLDESLAKESSLTEQAAAAEIARLRMERKLVEAQLALLVREDK
jgi:septal ring factor EnvC (AmiA/AmiB activator)